MLKLDLFIDPSLSYFNEGTLRNCARFGGLLFHDWKPSLRFVFKPPVRNLVRVHLQYRENGVKWYRTGKAQGKNGAWGFADENSEIALHLADNAKDEMDDKRLSLHVNKNGQWQGAHRCGH